MPPHAAVQAGARPRSARRARRCPGAPATRSPSTSSRASRTAAKSVPGAGVKSRPASAATSARNARRNSSFSSAPCQLVPHTAPRRQPSRKGSVRAAGSVTSATAVVDLVPGHRRAQRDRRAGRPRIFSGAEPDAHRQQPEPVDRAAARLHLVLDLAGQHLVAAADAEHGRPPGPASATAAASPRSRSQARSETVARDPGSTTRSASARSAGLVAKRTSTPGSAASASTSVKLLIRGSRTTATRRKSCRQRSSSPGGRGGGRGGGGGAGGTCGWTARANPRRRARGLPARAGRRRPGGR